MVFVGGNRHIVQRRGENKSRHKKSNKHARRLRPICMVMQYNFYRPLNGLVDREKFSRQLKINCMQAHVKLAHDRYFSASVNFFDSSSKICGLSSLMIWQVTNSFFPYLLVRAENPNNRQIKPRCGVLRTHANTSLQGI